jgi:hypothetical protein
MTTTPAGTGRRAGAVTRAVRARAYAAGLTADALLAKLTADGIAHLFPAGATVTGDFNTYSWTYFGPHGEQMVQATAGNTDTPVGLFTNGG